MDESKLNGEKSQGKKGRLPAPALTQNECNSSRYKMRAQSGVFRKELVLKKPLQR
jgi:hypothetical protein